MRSLKLTKVRSYTLLLSLFSFYEGYTQINSPYSRYGLGDLYNSRNVVNKGMGNVATPVIDYQSVNYINPASYSRLQSVSFDVGLEYESRNMKDSEGTESYKSRNLSFNYLALGLPIHKDKLGFTNWGMAFGIRPVTKMNYSIVQTGLLPGIDSIGTVYKGSGGASKAFIGTGYKLKGLALGVNVGFIFGHQNITTQRSILDTAYFYTSSHENRISYNKFFADFGAQYDLKVGKQAYLRLGFSGFVGQKMNASSDVVRETIIYNNTGGYDSLDVVYRENNVKGTIQMPSGYTAGIMFDKLGRFMLGGEYERVNWDEYRFYDKVDQVGSTEMFRFGGQWTPDLNTRKYLKRITYRAGFYTGTEYVKVNGEQLPIWAVTAGFGFPIRRWTNYTNQFTQINTSLEFGKRGNKDMPLTENFFRLNVGLCLSDLWFKKREFN